MKKSIQLFLSICFIGSILWLSCKKDPKWNLAKTKPLVKTVQVTEIKAKSVMASGDVVHNAGLSVSKYGFCISKNKDSITTEKSVKIELIANNNEDDFFGQFSYQIQNLQENTTYYLRAFASNEIGIGYGEVITFTTTRLAVLKTDTAISVSATRANCSGKVLNDWGYSISERGICYGRDTLPNIAEDSKMISVSGLSAFDCQITDLTSQTKFFYRAYAINQCGIAYGETKTFTTLNNGMPKIITIAPYNISIYSATCAGTVTDDCGSFVSNRGICYSTSQNPTTTNSLISSGNGIGTFSANMSGLLAGKTYYARAYAINAYGTAYGNEVSFTCSTTIPSITTNSITNLTDVTCTSGGNIVQDGGLSITQKGVCWSTSINPTVSNSRTNDGSGINSFISNVSGLNGSIIYYLRAYATNSLGTAYGNQVSFATSVAKTIPTVVTSSTINTGNYYANTTSNISSDGNSPIIARGVCWSTGIAPTIANSYTSDLTGTGSYLSTLTNLTGSTIYYYRAYATNAYGTAYGSIYSFATSVAGVASLTTNSISNISSSQATSGGAISNNGGSAITAKGVCWSVISNPTISNSKTVDGSGNLSFTSLLSSLAANTTYYVRAYAINGVGAAYGNQVSFVSGATVPSIVTTAPYSIALNSASSGGSSITDGGSPITAKGVCWSTTINPTISSSKTSNGTGTGNFTSAITGLTTGLTYYVRAYATNAIGTSYGATYSFTPNLAAPTLISPINNILINCCYFYLDWSCVTGATSYDLQISTSSTFTGTTYTLPKAPSGALRTSGVMSGTQGATCGSGSVTSDMMQTGSSGSSANYFWRVRARTSTATGAWSSTGLFRYVF